MTEAEASSHAGTPAQTLSTEGVTYVVGPSAMLIVVDVGDRLDGNAVQSVDSLTLCAPFPELVEAVLESSTLPSPWTAPCASSSTRV
jgi:hypothetical protein